MGQVTIYGASDDLIEVDGDVQGCDEYPSDDGTFTIAGEDGNSFAVVRVCFDSNGMWGITVTPQDEDIPAPTMRLEVERYSAKLIVDGVKEVEVNSL